jgi:predicted ATP-dependent endonuclease of OLD family
MDGKALPLESLGTGIQEVIILAAASTIMEDTVICMEEPELHLNPILQRKLVRYLERATSNQYFITTHSAALMDTQSAEIYHVRLDSGQSTVERVTSDRQRSNVCENLGYHPSDLLQANCIIWVEGPSDRLYLNSWIRKRTPELLEGIHYAIMFYGGRLASHLTGRDLDEDVNDFISLRRLNRRVAIVIDSDRKSGSGALNSTKQRLVAEFDKGPGHAWVTDGREIENYIPPEHVKAAIEAILPNAKPSARLGRYDKVLDLNGPQKAKQAPKVEIAKYVTANYEADEARFNLGERLDAMVAFIRSSNPTNAPV